ncbi:DUF6325 family protein [Microbacterium sp.]|uniref:DUF6325 family protein n=1 Tax=Microbacterium sp. TaxID=51671 RepID=UPI0037CC3F67
MDDLEYGPVELVLAGFRGDKPSAGVLDALAELAEAGTIRVIDLVHVTRDADGRVAFFEVDESGIDIGVIDLVAGGLASHEDVTELGSRLPVGAAAVLLVVEHLWAKRLASRLVEAEGFVVDSVRIPAPVVNLVAAAAAEATAQAGGS